MTRSRAGGRSLGNLEELAGCHLHQDQPECVDIRPLIGFFSFDSLRRHVGRRTNHVAGLRQARIARRSGQAEVQHFDAGLRHHDVRGLQIPMHDVPRVSHGQGRGNLRSESKCLCQGQLAALEARGHGFAFDQLHHEVVGADVMQGANVGVADRCNRTRLLPEAVEEGALGDLDGDRTFQAGIGRAVHLAHGALPEQRFDLVRPQLGTGSELCIAGFGNEVRGILIEQLVAGFGVLRQQPFHFPANLRISASQSFPAPLTGRVIELLDLPPALGCQALPQEVYEWYYCADSVQLIRFPALSAT